jgi:hypothetical protein
MLGRMLGAARLNVHTFEEVEQDQGATMQALLVVVLVTIASLVGGMLAGEEFNIVRGLVFGAIRGVAAWALWALVTWIVGSTILATKETKANWGELARCTGFAQTPGILSVFVFVPGVGWAIGLLVFFWQFAAMMVGVRQALDYTSTWRAFFVILISFIPVAILFIIFAIILGIADTSTGGEAADAAEQAFKMLGIGGFAAA